ncbi:glutathione S-transferase family protein [Persicimonas caeni]|uniref:Glutathione S-transferase family protein n=1 Tax=Persicimonas caeni TaxID=2292766 RepID=A0A4Y6PUC1_PERCE|nr:glutathione S-transferase family protein [Persicimonas caeni]QDG51355.1 glutathione S-transferase family protein [Persicimonas caeni]QED32576.1 glutathione S-transferase family protein [Persicimonas caeni]
MADELIFYTNPQSRGRIVRWMLEEVGAPYETVVLEYGDEMKSAEYLAVNPMGKVPAIRHGDEVVTECAAICAYLADAFPQAGLAPEPAQRAAYYRWLFFAAGPFESAITNQSLEISVAPEQERMVGYGNLAAVLDTLADAVSQRPYIAGDRFSAADVYVGLQIGFGLEFGTLEKRAEFVDYWGRIKDRPAKKRADELDNALVAGGGEG